jgi:hypothetical protein
LVGKALIRRRARFAQREPPLPTGRKRSFSNRERSLSRRTRMARGLKRIVGERTSATSGFIGFRALRSPRPPRPPR